MSDIPTWHERAMRHPEHQSGMISEDMLRARMAEEIEDLRAEVERLTRERDEARAKVDSQRAENELQRAEIELQRTSRHREARAFEAEHNRLQAALNTARRERDEARSKETDYGEGFDEGWIAAQKGAAAEVDRLREDNEKLRELLRSIRIDGPDFEGLVWVSFVSQGLAARAHVVVGEENRMASRVALRFKELRREALEAKP